MIEGDELIGYGHTCRQQVFNRANDVVGRMFLDASRSV